MRLVIAEKPSLARAIAAVVPNDVKVTHCFGHMLELADPSAYDPRWKTWAVETLPIRIEHWKLLPKSESQHQLNVIGSLLKQATEVIHAGDPDREGQLLVDEVLEHFGWHGPTKRLLVTDVNPEPILKAWRSLKNNAEFLPLRKAAESRQRADWLVGMNLTRAATKLLGDGALISIGRVQTPTLALVVRRHKAIAGFTEAVFYTLKAEFALSGNRTVELKCEPDPRITSERQASGLAGAVTGQVTTLAVKHEDRARRSPLPYKLGDFQRAAEHHFGWSLDKALNALQAAYEAGCVSYPRSDCRYLPSDHKDGAVQLAGVVASALGVPSKLLQGLAPKDRVYDSSQVKAHYGIVPTGKTPASDADTDAVKAWKLVSLHYLRTLMPDECYRETAVTAALRTSAAEPYATLPFKARGETPDGNIHWNSLDLDTYLPPPRKRKGIVAAPPLPAVHDGEPAKCKTCVASKGKTTPPKPYTPSSLRDDMEGVAKFATDPKMQAILKETEGIGTPATQGSIVKTLIKRGYLTVAKNGTLDASPFGIAIIEAVPAQLADPVLTAAWEKALGMIANGEYEAAVFGERVVALVDKHLAGLRQAREKGISIRIQENAPRVKTPKAKPKAAPKNRTTGPLNAVDSVFI